MLVLLLLTPNINQTIASDGVTISKGIAAFESGDYKKALSIFRPLAEANDANAQFYMGWMYDEGNGVTENDQEALKWYEKSAKSGNESAAKAAKLIRDAINSASKESAYTDSKVIAEIKPSKEPKSEKQVVSELSKWKSFMISKNYDEALKIIQPLASKGYSEAQYGLGLMYSRGAGVEMDLNKAFTLFSNAAKQGSVDGEREAGLLLISEESIPRNEIEAFQYFFSAAKSGDAISQFYLAVLYELGAGGVPIDYKNAAHWYKKAANKIPSAQNNLGVFFAKGLGVPENRGEARKLFQFASEVNVAARENLKALDAGSNNFNSDYMDFR